MRLENITLRQVFDSRGEATLEIELIDHKSRSFRATVPAGKSRGKSEAVVLSYPGAKNSLRLIKKKIIGKNFRSITEFDSNLLRLDRTKNKSRLGGNLSLGLSVSFARALAFERNKEVWQIIKSEFFKSKKTKRGLPLIFSNFINGGAHAKNNLNLQEYLVILGGVSHPLKSIGTLIDLYRKLGRFLALRAKFPNLPVGDEGGYSLNFKDNFEPISILESLIKKSANRRHFSLGLDAAATNFQKGSNYLYDGRRLNRETLLKKYQSYFERSRFLTSIEDPFAESDYEGFKKIRRVSPRKLIIGDDLTTTHPLLIRRFAESGLINAVIIKPNQIGTVSETCEAIKVADEFRLKTIISHRSGETEDNFIIHLARASGACGLKIGAPAKERLLKFNELIRIYQ